MKTTELFEAINSITPDTELKTRIIQLARQKPGFHLEKPARLIAALGAGALLCAGVVAGCMLLINTDARGSDLKIPSASIAPAAAANQGATAAPTDNIQATQTPDDSPAPTPIPASVKLKNDYPKLMDVVKISEKNGKFYVNDEYLLYVSNFPAYGFDEGWLKKLQNGELTKDEILAETALADDRAANYMTPFTINELPQGIIAPEEAVAIAKKAYMDYFSIDAGDCVLIDDFSYSVSTVFGTSDIAQPLYLQNKFAGKKMISVMYMGPVWYFQFYSDGAAGSNIVDVQMSVDAKTGDVVSGSLSGYGSEKKNYSKNELKQRVVLARQYVEKKEIIGQASIIRTENMKLDSDVSVTLSDGRKIIVTIDKNMVVQGFTIQYTPK